jgi:hypothetical protein
MNDFEVLPIGSIKEIKLSRDLSREIDQVLHQFGNVVPQNVMNAFLKLKDHYAWQIESELL